MNFKYDFDEDHYLVLCLNQHPLRSSLSTALSHCYKSKLPVSKAKKDAHLFLCRSGMIPDEHHAFYHTLPSDAGKQDHLEEPDFSNSGDETDLNTGQTHKSIVISASYSNNNKIKKCTFIMRSSIP